MVYSGMMFLFELERKEAVNYEDNTLDQSQDGLGNTEVRHAFVVSPASVGVVGQPSAVQVQDGTGYTEK